ncbi:hypothetical protein [Taibaiella chishuiensis]|uniref:hypothetical protein n=1 Tax=Taibaiella chishuiensis TaxID=1434707 RepID=UPI0015E66E1B|nr:hypothetical protein [Taibaiella chishuiensis]
MNAKSTISWISLHRIVTAPNGIFFPLLTAPLRLNGRPELQLPWHYLSSPGV